MCLGASFRSRYSLSLEILALRQQLGVLQAKTSSPLVVFRIVFNKRGKPGKYGNVAKPTVAVSMIRVMSDNLRIRRSQVRVLPGAPKPSLLNGLPSITHHVQKLRQLGEFTRLDSGTVSMALQRLGRRQQHEQRARRLRALKAFRLNVET